LWLSARAEDVGGFLDHLEHVGDGWRRTAGVPFVEQVDSAAEQHFLSVGDRRAADQRG